MPTAGTEAEERRQAFLKTLTDAEAEADRVGWVSAEDAVAQALRIIDEVERERRQGSRR